MVSINNMHFINLL